MTTHSDDTGSKGALAWHKDLELSPRALDRFLAGRWVGRLATNGSDGFPHVTPCYYYWDGHCVFVNLTKQRVPGRNLMRDPRCALVIDVDDRPLMGLARNWAIAVTVVGEAEISEAVPGQTITIEGGPWEGEQPVEEVMWKLVSRYGLSERDGAVGGSSEEITATLGRDAGNSRVIEDNRDRIVVKIRPKRIRSWDFSQAPLLG